MVYTRYFDIWLFYRYTILSLWLPKVRIEIWFMVLSKYGIRLKCNERWWRLVSTSAVRNSVKYRWFFRFIPWFILNLFTTLQHVYVNSFIWITFSLAQENESFVKVLLSPSSHSFPMHHGLINPASIFWRTSALKDGSNFFGCDKSMKSQTRY